MEIPTETKQKLQLHLLPTGELKFSGDKSPESMAALQQAIDAAQSIVRIQETIKQKYKWDWVIESAIVISLLAFLVGSISYIFVRSITTSQQQNHGITQ
jgi:hypothetical protein